MCPSGAESVLKKNKRKFNKIAKLLDLGFTQEVLIDFFSEGIKGNRGERYVVTGKEIRRIGSDTGFLLLLSVARIYKGGRPYILEHPP
jgi:hypothetical protein